jgi:tripartite-type tricarboxylate transporter receptor subunit TctC
MTRLTRRAALAAPAALLAVPALAQPRWPVRPVTLLCPWAAGGGTDQVLRILAALLEKELGQPFNVVNRTGGSGVVGHAAIAQANPDGYTLGLLTVEICMMHHQGLTEVNRNSYTPLALVNNDPAALQVNASSPHRTAQALADAVKASRPGQLKAGGTGQGGIWHLACAVWLTSLGLKPDHIRWVPTQGAAPAMQELAANGLDLTTNSLPEARAMLDANRARSLAVMGKERVGAFPTIPTMKEAIGVEVDVGAWRGMAGPKGLPANVTAAMEAALAKIHQSKEFREPMESRGLGLLWADGAGFGRFMEAADTQLGQAMREAGLAKS